MNVAGYQYFRLGHTITVHTMIMSTFRSPILSFHFFFFFFRSSLTTLLCENLDRIYQPVRLVIHLRIRSHILITLVRQHLTRAILPNRACPCAAEGGIDYLHKISAILIPIFHVWRLTIVRSLKKSPKSHPAQLATGCPQASRLTTLPTCASKGAWPCVQFHTLIASRVHNIAYTPPPA